MVAKNVILTLKSEFLDFAFAKLSATQAYRNRLNYHYTAKPCTRAGIGKFKFDSNFDKKSVILMYKDPPEKGQVGSLPRGKLDPQQSRDNYLLSLKKRDSFLYQVTINLNKP